MMADRTTTETIGPSEIGLSEEERYLFDLHGYLLVEDALAAEQVEELNRLIDSYDLWDENSPIHARATTQRRFAGTLEINHVYGWDQPFLDLVANPRVMRHVTALVGPIFRLDQANAIIQRTGAGRGGLHGGGTEHFPTAHYGVRNGQIVNGMIVVSYALRDAKPGHGGFGAVPGSHKSLFRPPAGDNKLDQPKWWVREVAQPAGSALIFTEALRHGTLTWRAPHERRQLFYRYIPAQMAWVYDYPIPPEGLHLSPQVGRMLARPYFTDQTGIRPATLEVEE